MDRMPIHCSMDEFERLHSVAYAAAIQTGAKGRNLDEVTAGVFRSLLAEANARATAIPMLQLVE